MTKTERKEQHLRDKIYNFMRKSLIKCCTFGFQNLFIFPPKNPNTGLFNEIQQKDEEESDEEFELSNSRMATPRGFLGVSPGISK